MKISNSLLQAITLCVSVAAFTVTTSCEKEKIQQTEVDHSEEPERNNDDNHCPACGMG